MKNQKSNNIPLPPVSMQTFDADLVVKMEDAEIEPVAIDLEKEAVVQKVAKVKEETIEELEIEKMANDIKIAIAKSELKEENETKIEKVNDTEEVESLEVPISSAPEAQYLEELADLSKEIDKERSQ